MVTCPWCGTSYEEFQSSCGRCGGPMAIPGGQTAAGAEESPQVPPPPPRPIADRYVWKLLASDGWGIAALVFGILGAVFTLVGAALTLGIVTAFVGIPFLALGLLFLGGGAAVAVWRYQTARKIVGVLQTGEAVEGQITQVEQNLSVQVNGRSPWIIQYQFQSAGQTYTGRVSTLNTPGEALQPERRAYILYLPQEPQRNVLYPHP
jgi:hypothetical protein